AARRPRERRRAGPAPLRRGGNGASAHPYHERPIIAWRVVARGGTRRLDRGETGRADEALAPRGVFRRQRAELDDSSAAPLESEGPLDRDHELEVERVTAVAGDDVRADPAAQQREVAEEVQDLVPDELVTEAKAVQRRTVAEHDRVVERAAAGEAVLAHDAQVLEEAVRARRRELFHERPLGRRPREHLSPDCRMLVVERVADAE